MRWFAVLLLGACTKMPTSSSAAATASASASVTDAAAAPDADAASAAVTAPDAAPDAVADAGRAPPRQVLHVGDSMVGGYGGLTKALEAHFKPLGSKFARDWQTSVSVQTYARDKHFAELIAKHDPDLVIITLGANDILAPFPKSLGSFVAAIAKKTAGRECWWLPPVPWKAAESAGPAFIQMLQENAAPCKVYDGWKLTITRGPDGIHPTDSGGQKWADGFLKEYTPAGEK